MVVRANIVKNQTIGVDLNQKAGGFSAPVQSVNSKTGDVILNANDVGADPEGTAEEKVSEHNADTEAHNDIRMLIQKARELIEDVATGKVNVSDIIDNLTTNVANKPLSAAQGVALKNSIDGLQTAVNRIKVPTKVSELENDNKYLTAVPDKYITETELDAKGYLTSVPSEYVTETELNAKGYLTQHQDLSGYAKKATTLAGYGITDAASKQELNSYGKVKTVNYMTPDANGNINVEGGSGKESNAFELIPSDTLVWNGNTDGKIVVANSSENALFHYVHVSNVIPTLAELQNGGIWATTDEDGIEYDETFASSDVVQSDNLINCFNGYVLIAEADSVNYTKGTATNCILPKAGVYFIYFGDEGYASKLTINNYKGFTKSILKMENLTIHSHDWYGKARNKGNTVRGDDNIHGGLVKVSDVVPKLAEVQKGGKIRRYDVVNGEITGDLIIENYLENPYTIMNSNNEILITSDGIVMVKITNSGVYFRQDQYDCIHSLTINDYTGFTYNVEKIPAELLPDNIGGGGITSWNDLQDKPFGEVDDYVIPETTLDWTNQDGMYVALLPDFEAIDGETYTVKWGGVEYSTQCISVEGNISLGNQMILGGEDTGEPFAIVADDGMNIAVDLTGNPPTNISVYGKCIKYIEHSMLAPLPIIDLTSVGNITTNYKEYTTETPIDWATLNKNANRGLIQVRVQLEMKYNTISGSSASVNGDVYTLPATIVREGSGFVLTAIFEGAVIIQIHVFNMQSVAFVARQIFA